MARILVVDDEPPIGAMTGEWLMELGHVVVEPAGDLAAALKLAETGMDAAMKVFAGSSTGPWRKRDEARRPSTRPDPAYLNEALIASSAFDRGHNSPSASSLSGRAVVSRMSCSSSASSSI